MLTFNFVNGPLLLGVSPKGSKPLLLGGSITGGVYGNKPSKPPSVLYYLGTPIVPPRYNKCP